MSHLFDIGPLDTANALEAQRAESPAVQMNPQQRAAVLHGDGPMLVVAGAGTGKTRVITERIRHLLDSQPGLLGEQILGLTFTEKAAGEMKSRVAATAGERGKNVVLGTFHQFCHGILEEFDPTLRVLNPVDHWILLRRNLRLLKLERYRRLAEPGQFLGDFERFFSRCQDELVTPDDYQRYADGLSKSAADARGKREADEVAVMEEVAAQQQEIARAYRASDTLIRDGHMLTFGSMLMEAVRRVDADPALAEKLRTRFRYVLVDEFQDTNIAQLELLWRLAGEHRNIFAVGDDDQAIYRFRGASFGSFKLFIERFGQGDVNVPVQALTQNYRSTERILRVSNNIIALNERSDMFPPKQLTAQHRGGEKVRVAELASAAHEARWVAGEIARLHAAGARWRGFAVLYRAHANRDKLVEELSRLNIPFVIRNLTIFGNALVRDVMAYLRLIATPSDNISFARAMSAPAWGFTAKDLVRLAEWARTTRPHFLWDTLVEALKNPQRADLLTAGNHASEFIEMIQQLRKRMKRVSALQMFDDLASELELGVHAAHDYKPYIARFRKFVQEWEPKSETQKLAEFVEYLDLYEQAGGQINLEEETGQDAVQLMTVHAAKGLEFDHVFILKLTQGNFPKRARPAMLEFPDELMKEERPRGDFHVQEERRLFYVALTRARARLTLTAIVDNKRNKPSPFLDDVLEDPVIARRDIERLAPKEAAGQKGAAAGDAAADSAQTDLFAGERATARVFSQIHRWAEEYRPPISEPLALSASAIDSYNSCPQKYLFNNVWGLREGPHAAMSFGNTMHTTIKHFVAELRGGRKLPFEEVVAIFEREWNSAGYEDDYQREEYKKDGLEQLRALHTFLMEAEQEVHDQEKPFELQIDGGILLTGRMDQINRIGAGQFEIVDYKTGRPKSTDHARKDLQLSIYALAARDVLELNAMRLVFHNLSDNSRVETTRDDKLFKKVLEKINETAADIRAGNFEANVNLFYCKSCEFRPICPAHEQKLVVLSSGR